MENIRYLVCSDCGMMERLEGSDARTEIDAHTKATYVSGGGHQAKSVEIRYVSDAIAAFQHIRLGVIAKSTAWPKSNNPKVQHYNL